MNFSALAGEGGYPQLGCLSSLGEERLIRAVAGIMPSPPLTQLHRKEALDSVFKEGRKSRREISEAQGLCACAYTRIMLLGDLARLVVLTVSWR